MNAHWVIEIASDLKLKLARVVMILETLFNLEVFMIPILLRVRMGMKLSLTLRLLYEINEV